MGSGGQAKVWSYGLKVLDVGGPGCTKGAQRQNSEPETHRCSWKGVLPDVPSLIIPKRLRSMPMPLAGSFRSRPEGLCRPAQRFRERLLLEPTSAVPLTFRNMVRLMHRRLLFKLRVAVPGTGATVAKVIKLTVGHNPDLSGELRRALHMPALETLEFLS